MQLGVINTMLRSDNNMDKNVTTTSETVSTSPPSSRGKSIDDVYIILAKKEKDLQLAAELGKALLEKNDDLSKANERITEEYTHKLELLEQEKHKLKQKVNQLDAEYENRIIELQADCNILKNQLDEHQQVAKQVEKEKSKLIDDLVQQNQRLTGELSEATKSETLLSSQLEQMNERFNARLSNKKDYVAQLEGLKEEIRIVNQRKQDLERRLKLAASDKSQLNAVIEELGDKLLLMENLLNEKDMKLAELAEEVGELRDSSCWLSSELESMINLNEKLATQTTGGSDDEQQVLALASEQRRSQLVDRLKELRRKNQSRIRAGELLEMNRRRVLSTGNRRSVKDELRRDYRDEDDDEGHICEELSSDLVAKIFSMLRRFQATLQQRKESLLTRNIKCLNENLNSADDSGISQDDSSDKISDEHSMQSKDLVAWKRLLDSLKSLIEDMPCSTCQLMIAERADYEQLQKVHSKVCDEIKRKNESILELQAQNLQQEAQVNNLNEKCSILSEDLKNCDLPKEEIVKLAWKARDKAVERKNNAEICLAKTRIENMQISSQLMEVVQQKGELSQKLAQFEDDIHYITQDSVKAKFTWEEYAEQLRRSKQQQQELNGQNGLSSGANSNGNPLTSLLNFSSAVYQRHTATGLMANHCNQPATNGKKPANGNGNDKPTLDSLTQPTANLVRNLASTKFNLRFWQKTSPSQPVDKVSIQQQQPASLATNPQATPTTAQNKSGSASLAATAQ